MTLVEAATEGGVSVQYLRKELGLADDTSPDDRIGPQLRAAGKQMSDLRRLLSDSESAAPTDTKETKP